MTAGPRLELTWPHKDEFLLVPKDDDGKPVWVSRDHPAAHEVRLTRQVAEVGEVTEGDPYSDNTVFVGDSLDALRVMCEVPEYAQRYRGKVKLVYIDPPFNTGQTFTHYDDWMEHATWLSFMRERLLLIRDLLAPTAPCGSIWTTPRSIGCAACSTRSSAHTTSSPPSCGRRQYSPRMDAKTFRRPPRQHPGLRQVFISCAQPSIADDQSREPDC